MTIENYFVLAYGKVLWLLLYYSDVALTKEITF